MTDSTDRQLQLGNHLSHSRSQRSQTTAPQLKLARLHSGTYLDDQSHFHHQDRHEIAGYSGETSSSEELDITEKEQEHKNAARRGSQDLDAEVGFQTEGHTDLEAGPTLEKRRSTRTPRDPNLVDWDGSNDPENPKNWLLSRKWAATLIGMYHNLTSTLLD